MTNPIASPDAVAAIESGDAAALEGLVTADPALASARTPEGVSLVLLALYHGQASLAGLLRERRSELDLFESAALGDLGQLRARLAEDVERVEARAADGFTALHLAAFFGRDRAARLLLAAGADVEAQGGPDGLLRPLHSAAASRQAGLVRLLLGAGADPDAAQGGGYTALHSAARHGNVPMVTALLSAGAGVDLRADDGRDAAALAGEAGEQAVLRLLEGATA